jgi:tetratricopeptide (TPR) repeat protein
MVTTKKRAPGMAICLLLALAGCGPPGPRALLDGEKRIHERHYDEAVAVLRKAVELIPLNAQAWNHLGLAYHYSQQSAEALRAYRKARELDRNLSPVCFNLGCLEAETGNYSAAVDDLTTFVSLETRSVPGYLRLASAETHLAVQSSGAERTRLLEAARQGFEFVNLVHPSREESAEALNGLGLIAIYRAKTRDAANYFDAALQKLPGYGPALLNLAVIYQNRPADRAFALAKYREYLAIRPAPPNAAAVEAAARQLEQDMRPPPPAPPPAPPPIRPAATNAAAMAPSNSVAVSPAPTNRVAVSPPPTNRAAAPIQPVAPPFVHATETKSVAPPVVHVTEPKTAPAVAPTGAPRSVEIKPAPPPKPVALANSNPPPVEVIPLPPEASQSQIIAPAKPPVYAVAPPPVPPPDRATSPPEPLLVTPAVTASNPAPSRPGVVPGETPKPSLVTRLNPVHWFYKKNKSPPPPEVKTATNTPAPAPVPPPAPAPAPKPVFARYHYLRPSTGAPGDRSQAAKLFADGVALHKNQRYFEASRLYEKAANVDPAYFEAYYNLGLASYEADDMPASLAAYEHALALNPNYKDLRYNFALALLKANYPLDAVDEFQRLAGSAPDDVRVQLSLANIFAQKLDDPDRARRHYLRVLELEPRHPQAGAIRSWIADNPG